VTDVIHLTNLYDAWQASNNNTRDNPAVREWYAARRAALGEFAAQRGWKVSSKEFTFETLRAGRRPRGLECGRLYPVIDHPDFFTKDGRPVAIVTHSYAPDEEVRLWAAEQRLHLEALPFSWYAPPQRTLAYVITRPDDANGVLIQ
jgi:hypothetical protein